MKYLPLIFLVFACRSVVPPSSSSTFDSTMVETHSRIDTLYLPGEVVELPPIYIECDSTTNKPKPFTQTVDGKRIDLKSKLNNKGLLTVKCTCDSLATVVTLQDKEIFRLRQEKKVVVVPPKITHTPYWFDLLFRWWALITAIILLWKYRAGWLSLVKKLI
jgi:hypothetical protein